MFTNLLTLYLGGIMVGELSHGGVGPNSSMMQASNNQPTIMHQNPNPVNVQPVINSYF